jgi:hypothetical protein
MDKTVKSYGGGTEGEEYVACSAKVMTPETKWNRHVDSSKLFTSIQEAINSLA